ncbi:MAG: GTP-binding protein [Syntrophotaleaceae bacterium]
MWHRAATRLLLRCLHHLRRLRPGDPGRQGTASQTTGDRITCALIATAILQRRTITTNMPPPPRIPRRWPSRSISWPRTTAWRRPTVRALPSRGVRPQPGQLPGSGKTTLLEKTLRDLQNICAFAVVEGDQQTDNDAWRIAATGVPVKQINTGAGCHLMPTWSATLWKASTWPPLTGC